MCIVLIFAKKISFEFGTKYRDVYIIIIGTTYNISNLRYAYMILKVLPEYPNSLSSDKGIKDERPLIVGL